MQVSHLRVKDISVYSSKQVKWTYIPPCPCVGGVSSIWSHKHIFVHKNFVKITCKLLLFNLTLCFQNVMQKGNFAKSIQNQKLSIDISKRLGKSKNFFPLSKNTCQITLLCESVNVWKISLKKPWHTFRKCC